MEENSFVCVGHTKHLDSLREASPDVGLVEEITARQTKVAENLVEVLECVDDVVQSDFPKST